MTAHALTRQSRPAAPETALVGPISFVHGRVHEICGPARRSLAVMLAGRLAGPVLWLRPAWAGDRICADGAVRWLNPGRIVFLDARSALDIQWCMEEALRSAAAPVVIAEFPEPPGLTPVRRLHLAAQAAIVTPALALLLTPGSGGAAGVETRWHMAATHEPGRTAWRLTRLRARMAPPASWALSDTGAALEAA